MLVATVISTVTAVVSASIAAFALRRAASEFRDGAQLQAFFEFTRRYEVLLEEIPARFRSDDPWAHSGDDDLSLRLRYLNLCSEEYYLMEQGLLSPQVWCIWDKEIKRTLASDPFVDAWPQLASEFESYPEFVEFVEGVQGPRLARANEPDEVLQTEGTA